MKTKNKTLLALTLGLALCLGVFLGVQPKALAFHCVSWVGSICAVWAPDPPPGMFDCTSDPTVYAGEFLMFTGTNFTGTCVGFNSSLNWASLADFNDLAKSAKNRRGHTVTLYQHNNHGGLSKAVVDGADGSNLWANQSDFGVSSLHQ